MSTKLPTILRLCLQSKTTGKELILAALGCLLGSFLFLFAVQFYTDSQNIIGEKEPGGSFSTLNKKVEGGLLQNLSTNNKSFSQNEILEIQQMEGVKDIGSFSRNHFPLTVHVWPTGKIGLGAAARADLFFESIPDRFLDQIPEEWAWEENDPIVPIMVPKFYLDLWNFGLAPSRQEYPALSLESASSMPVEIFIGEDRSQRLVGRFVAFSKRINSVLVPPQFLQWANAQFAEERSEKYFFVWEGDEIKNQPVSFTELKNLPESTLDGLVVSPLEEPANQIVFKNLSLNESERQEAARLIVKIKDSYAQRFSEKVDLLGYETNREMPEQGWVRQAIEMMAWGVASLGGLLSILSIATFTSSFKLMIAQSASTARNLLHLGFSQSQICWVFFQRFSKLFLWIWAASLLLCLGAKSFVHEKISLYGLEITQGLSWQTYTVASFYAVLFMAVNYWVIHRSVRPFCLSQNN